MSTLTATPARGHSVEQALLAHVAAPEKFRSVFRQVRAAYPQEALRASLRYLGIGNKSSVSRQILLWLSSGPEYLPTLFDPDILNLQESKMAAAAIRDSDGQFFARLARFLQDPRQTKSIGFIVRVLNVIPVLGECGLLLPWLRALTEHADEQIRLQSAKAMCELRPTVAMVERQLKSSEPQTRADALAALWRVQSNEAASIFRFALSDPDHRVLANALVGLHLNRDAAALEKLIELTHHKSAAYRLSMIGAMQKIQDARCRPALEALTEDSVPAVREEAKVVLAQLPAEPRQAAVVVKQAPPVDSGENTSWQKDSEPSRLSVPTFRLL